MSAEQALYGLVGAGGHGREVMPLVRAQLASLLSSGAARIVFVVENDVGGRNVNGIPLIGLDQFLDSGSPKFFNVAIAASDVRKRIALKCAAFGAQPFSIIASTAIVHDDVEIGPGAILCPFSIIQSNSRIGSYFHANSYSSIAHDSIVGDYVTLGPRATCNGRSRIGNHAYIGSGAVIREGTPECAMVIGEGAIVGMGAIVTKPVAAGTTVIGNPARLLEKQ
jgi:sugar O-acyltransferase (sialic acid O-acetyltransferase NeuD family)